nr:MAG TPA: hypothetical protein [Caudoviricetes sp.]
MCGNPGKERRVKGGYRLSLFEYGKEKLWQK